jgi:hypothetical protein
VKIAILIEGDTEKVFMPHLRAFLGPRLEGRMPRLDSFKYDGRIPKYAKLKRVVEDLLRNGNPPADAVIALTDVYTGSRDFHDAADAKRKMCEWVGPNDRFFPHAAQYDFEAWLLPFWDSIQALAGHNKAAPSGLPESVNHQRPPSSRIKEIFRVGRCPKDYVKPRDAARLLLGKDLAVAAAVCPELKAFINRILELSGGECL